MTVPSSLSRMVKYHFAAGVVFSLALLAYIMASNYRASVVDISSRAAAMNANAASMNEDTVKMKNRQTEVLRALPAGFESTSPRETVLLRVERLKDEIRGATITLDEFNEANSTLTLPVTIEFDSTSFEEGAKSVRKLWASGMPYFEFRNIDIRRLEGSYNSARYKIEGIMTMPSAGILAQGSPEKTL